VAAQGQFLRSKGTEPIGRARVAFVTGPIASVAGDDPWAQMPDALRGTRPLDLTQKNAAHRRFDPEISRRDGLARLADVIAARQAAIAEHTAPGRNVRLRAILELDALRELEADLREFDSASLGLIARVEAANLLQKLSLLDPANSGFHEERFRMRQRLAAIAAGEFLDERIVSTACMAVRALEDAVRRLMNGRTEPAITVLDAHAQLIEEQRVHALVSMLKALGRGRLVGLSRESAEAVLQTFRKVDPQAFGFDPRNQRFVRHMAELIDRVSSVGRPE
jgi:hypothetical protein